MRRRAFSAGSTRAGALAALCVVIMPGCAAHQYRQVSCEQSRQSIFVLEAQAVPSATLIPCMGSLPQGWSYAGSEVQSGLVRFWFNSDRVGPHAIEVLMTGACDVSGASEVSLAAPPPGLRRYEEASARHPGTSVSYFVFPGACVTYRFSFTRHESPRLYAEADRALGFTPRSLYVNSLRQHARITLCGTGAPPCPG